MRFVNKGKVLSKFTDTLAKADRVDICLSSFNHGPALEQIVNWAQANPGRARILLSLSAGPTDPTALAMLRPLVEIRLLKTIAGVQQGGVCAFYQDANAIVWTGLTELSRRTTIFEHPLIVESNGSDAAAILDWFDTEWQAGEPLSDDILASYADRWRLPAAVQQMGQGGGQGFDHPFDIVRHNDVTDWDSFVVSLERSSAFRMAEAGRGFGLFDEYRSLSQVLDAGLALLRHVNWADQPNSLLTEVILGRKEDGASTFVTFGGAKKRTVAKGYFLGEEPEDRAVREKLQSILVPLAEMTGEDVFDDIGNALTEICNIAGIDGMTATRLMTLARPDRCAVVHNGTGKALGELADLPQTPMSLAKPKNYVKLISHLAELPWIDCPEPDDAREHYLWRRRAAFMECLCAGWQV